MKIDKSNLKQICSITISGSNILRYYYRYETRELRFTCRNEIYEKEFDFLFRNVLFSTIYNNTEDKPNEIEKMDVKEHSEPLQYLLSLNGKNERQSPWLEWDIPYVTIVVQTKAGTELVIICDDIYFKETKYSEQRAWHSMRSSECSLYSTKQIAEIRNIDIHDSDFYSMNYDDARKTLSFRCENLYSRKTFSFRFLDVLAYSMQSCSYYGRDTRLWEISAENYVINGVSVGIQKHFTKKGKVDSDEKKDCFRYLYPYFTVRFELASGDVLMISCKSVEVEKFGI